MKTIKRVLRRLSLPVHGLPTHALTAFQNAEKERVEWRLKDWWVRRKMWRGKPWKQYRLLREKRRWLEMVIRWLAADLDSKPGHWFSSDIDDPGADWCRDCAEKRLLEIRAQDPERLRLDLGWTAEELAETSDDELCRRHKLIDGGWTTDHDHPIWCEVCGVMLDGCLTEYGAQEEIAHWTEYGPIPIDYAAGWACLELACDALGDRDPLWQDVEQIVMRSIRASVPRKSRLCRNTRARRGAK